MTAFDPDQSQRYEDLTRYMELCFTGAIRYHVLTDSGTDVMIHLYGRDYVGPKSPEDNRRRLEVISVPSTEFVLGRTTLSKIALFVDNRAKTIAIGEPL